MSKNLLSVPTTTSTRYFHQQENPMKKKLIVIRKGRTRALFNTGTRPHKSIKDYTRKVKHKRTITENEY